MIRFQQVNSNFKHFFFSTNSLQHITKRFNEKKLPNLIDFLVHAVLMVYFDFAPRAKFYTNWLSTLTADWIGGACFGYIVICLPVWTSICGVLLYIVLYLWMFHSLYMFNMIMRQNLCTYFICVCDCFFYYA